jgi:hypothetical protein
LNTLDRNLSFFLLVLLFFFNLSVFPDSCLLKRLKTDYNMATNPLSVSQREPYEHSSFTHFLWWLSTAEKEIITDCTIDRNRYSIIGFIVLTTWAFATGAWTYFFSTAIESPWIFVPLGLFMGFIVLCIDRALIKGINRKNRNRLTPFLFRGLLAVTIGLFMAQPAILFLFDKEIKVQISLDNRAGSK